MVDKANTGLYFFFIISFFLLFNSNVGAQETATLNGEIVNAKGIGVPFANVALYKQGEIEMVMGTVSDDKGYFSFTSIIPGTYKLQAFFVGFESFTQDSILIHTGENHLAPIYLKRKDTELDEITIVSEKMAVERYPGKTVYNMGEGSNIGENALEVFRNIPSLGVDMDDNITMRGTKVTVLIDGVESDLADMLDQLPTDVIASVEVINNPSAKYDSKNGGGVINIKLKSDKLTGYNGKITAGYGYPERYNLTGSMGLTVKKWSFNSAVSYKKTPFEEYRLTERSIFSDKGTKFLIQDQHNDKTQEATFLKASARYLFSKKSFINLQCLYQGKTSPYESVYQSQSFNTDTVLTSLSDINREQNNNNGLVEFAGHYRLISKSNTDRQLNIVVKYSTDKPEMDFLRQTQPLNISTFEPTDKFNMEYNLTEEVNNFKLVKVDYDYPINENVKIEIGGQLGIRHFMQDKIAEKSYLELSGDDIYTSTKDLSSQSIFKYDEIKPACYIVFSTMVGKYNLSAGLRYENNYRKQANIDTISYRFSNNIQSISPSLLIEKKVSKKYSWGISYSIREKAPGYNQLNPISTSFNTYYQNKGNPDLQSQKTHNVDFNHNYTSEKFSFTGSVFLKQVNDIIGTNYSVSEIDGEDVTEAKYDNLGNMSNWGFDFSSTIRLKELVLRPAVTTYYKTIKGDKFSASLDKDEICAVGKISADYNISKTFTIQAIGRYNSSDITPQGKKFDYYTLDLGLRAKVLDKKGNVSLKIVDLLDSYEYTSVINQRTDQYTETFYDAKGRYVYLAFSYKLSVLKNKGKKKIMKKE